MNKAILIGNLGRDPETRNAGGKTVCEFSLATSEGRDETTWHRIICWEKTAELCTKYLNKGSRVAVEGRINVRDWTDKEGNKRQTTEIVAHRVEFLSERSERPERKKDDSFGDDEIPF